MKILPLAVRSRTSSPWRSSVVFLKKMHLTVTALLAFVVTFGISSVWFPKATTVSYIPVEELEQLDELAQVIGKLLDEPESIKNQQIQQLIDQGKYGPFHLLYMDWSIKLANSGTPQPTMNKSFFNRISDSQVNITIPVGIDRVKGLLVATRTIPTLAGLFPSWWTQFMFSLGFTLLLVASVLWLKARKLIHPIDELTQQFTRYRREYETKDIDLPESILRQTDLERRVTILQDLWIKFQSIQEQLSGKEGRVLSCFSCSSE